MFLHQIFYQGLKARIASWPTLVLGKKHLLYLLRFLFMIFFFFFWTVVYLTMNYSTPLSTACVIVTVSLYWSLNQPTCSISCCPCWTSTRSLWGTTSTACRSWLTASRTATLTSCWSSMRPSPTVRRGLWRPSSPTPCSRLAHLSHWYTQGIKAEPFICGRAAAWSQILSLILSSHGRSGPSSSLHI